MKKIIIVCALVSLCTKGVKAQNTPIFSEVVRLSDNVNSKSEEAKPVLNSDGTIMYFVRAFHAENVAYDKKPENEDIWESIKDKNGEWQKAEHETTINNDKNNSIIGQGKEDHFFLLNTYQDKKKLQYGIAQTRKLAEHNWTTPEITEIPKLKYKGNFYDFYITHDEQILIISIKGDDSKGEEDLYVSMFSNGKWSEPKNLGDIINTSGFEMSPFLTEDKKYLFFSSNGRKDGLGDADIYVTERLDDSWTNWSTPKNMGAPVNSPAMDCYFTMSDNGDYYFSSNRSGESGLDIYQAIIQPPFVKVKFNILSAKDSSVISASLKLFQNANTDDILKLSSEVSNHDIELDKNNKYVAKAEKIGFKPLSGDLSLLDINPGDVFVSNLYLIPEEKLPDPIVLKRVLHEFDEASHSGDTKMNIDDVVQKMKENPWMKIAIESHTDSKGSDEYNMELSKKRALSNKSYLVSQGISENRIEVRYFGKSKPVVSNQNSDGSDNPEGRAQNRRTEFIILSNQPEK